MSDGNGLGALVARSVSSMYLVQMLAIPLSVAANLIAGQKLDPSDYGIFATAIFVVGLVQLVTNAGLAQTLIRHPEELTEKDYAAVFAYQAVTGLGLGALLYAGATGIGTFFGEYARTAEMIRWLAIIPVLDCMTTIPIVKIERGLRYQGLAFFSIFWTLAERILLIYFLWEGVEGFSYVFSRILGVVLQVISLSAIARWNPVALVRQIATNGWRGTTHLKYGLAIQLRSVAGVLVQSIVPGVGGRLFVAEEVGLLSWTHNVSVLASQPLPQSVGKVLNGASSRFSRSPEAFRSLSERALLACTLICSVILFQAAAVMPELIRFLFKPRWHNAPPFFALWTLVMVESILLTILDALVMALGMPMVGVVAQFSWAGASAVLCTAGSMILGPRGLVIGFVFSCLVPITILWAKLRSTCPIGLTRHFFAPLAISAFAGMATYSLKGPLVSGVASMIALCALSASVAVAVQFLVYPELWKSIREMMDLRRKGTADGIAPAPGSAD